MFVDIETYIQLSRESRRVHLRLDDPCIEIGGRSDGYRGLLAHYLRTTIPSGMKILLCHACNNDKCSNPVHLYWGTPQDNHIDCVECGRYRTIDSLMLNKYGAEKTKAIKLKNSSSGGKASQLKKKITRCGLIGKPPPLEGGHHGSSSLST